MSAPLTTLTLSPTARVSLSVPLPPVKSVGIKGEKQRRNSPRGPPRPPPGQGYASQLTVVWTRPYCLRVRSRLYKHQTLGIPVLHLIMDARLWDWRKHCDEFYICWAFSLAFFFGIFGIFDTPRLRLRTEHGLGTGWFFMRGHIVFRESVCREACEAC